MNKKMRILSIERFIANKYNHLLIMLVVFLFFAPSLERGIKVPGISLITFLLILTIVLCLRVTVVSKKIFWFCALIAALAFCLDIIGMRIENLAFRKNLGFMIDLTLGIFILMTIILLMKSMFKTRHVDANTIVGGICVYLLIGILWALLYIFLSDIKHDIISFEPGASMFYFSFTTLTTLGYGDIIPKGRYIMMIANFEAVTGQMFIAVFVARLVGLHTASQFKSGK